MSTAIEQETQGTKHEEEILIGEQNRRIIMFALGSKTVFRATVIIFAAIVAVLTLSTPASAIDGRTAVGQCIDSTASGARCAWAVSKDGSIDICNKNGCVTCPSATSECTMARKGRLRPITTLPVGTEVITELGSFIIHPVTLSTPATATDGRTAVGRCLDSFASGVRCAWAISKDGSIDICNKNGCVSYPSATATRTMDRRGRPRPTTALPAGTEVITEVSSFKIRRR